MGEENKRRSFIKHLLSMTAFGAGSVLALRNNIANKISGLELSKADAAVSSGTKVKSLEERIAALEAVHDVQDLMSRYFHYHAVCLNKRCYDELFAQKAPDVSAEIANWGRWEGPEHVKTFFYKVLGGDVKAEDRVGMMMLHQLDTPCIQVAGDGKTVKGVWYSPGNESSADKKTGKGNASWCWSYIATDFIKEDGVWRIWHYHCYALFKTPFDKPWTELTDATATPPPTYAKGEGPNKPTTYFNEYRPTNVRELVPAPPMPYETFDPSKAY
jgi:hypothetical protein